MQLHTSLPRQVAAPLEQEGGLKGPSFVNPTNRPFLGPIPSRDTSQTQKEEAPAAGCWAGMHVQLICPRTD